MPDTENIITSNYHAVYEKDGGKVIAVFNGSRSAQEMVQTDRAKLEATYCGEAINLAFVEGKNIIRNESGVMDVQKPLQHLSLNPEFAATLTTSIVGDDALKLQAKDGSHVLVRQQNAALSGSKEDPAMGEIFYLESTTRQQGIGTKLSQEALLKIVNNGGTKVKVMGTSPEGRAFIQGLVSKGLISPAIETSETGSSVHNILAYTQKEKITDPRPETAWRELGEKVAFNLPPNGSVFRPTQADFKYSANKLNITIANATRAWHYKMGDIEMPKTKAPEVVEAVAPVAPLDPAAQKFLDDRQRHNDQADEHLRLRKVGQEALPGIRYADAAEVGRVWEMHLKGDLNETEWDAYKNQLISENRVTVMSREDYERNPVFDDAYTGPRFKYGMRNRPYGFATAPKGAILMSYNPEDKEAGSRHGTIEYPFQLTKDEVYNFELVDFPAIKQQEIDFRAIRNSFVDELEKRGFVLTVSDSEGMLADLAVPNGFIQAGIRSYGPEYQHEYHLTLNTDKLNNPIELDYKTPADIDIERSLRWIDKEIAKTVTDIPELSDHEKHIQAVYHSTVLHYEGEMQRRGFTTVFGENEQSMIATLDLPDNKMLATRIYQDKQGYHTELTKNDSITLSHMTFDTPAEININRCLEIVDSELANHILDSDTTKDMFVIHDNDPLKSLNAIDPNFAEFVMKQDQGHNEGYSPRESVLHVNATALSQGLDVQWTCEDNSDYGPMSIAGFTINGTNDIGGAQIFNDGKAMFFLNGERFKEGELYASCDPETQTWAIEGLANAMHIKATPELTDTDKIKALALCLAKADTELSFNEITTATGLLKDDIEKHWTVANKIADAAVKDANLTDISYQIDRHTHYELTGPLSVIYSQSESDAQQEPMFWSNAVGWSSYGDETATFTNAELETFNVSDITSSKSDSKTMLIEDARKLSDSFDQTSPDGAYMNGRTIIDHAYGLKNACELHLKDDPARYDHAAESRKLEQAEFIITNIDKYDLRSFVYKLDYQAAMGGNPLMHDHEERRQSVINQTIEFAKSVENYKQEQTPAPANESPADPETALRELWTKKGVSQERQDELLAEITAKAAPGAQVGPFQIPLSNTNPSSTHTPQEVSPMDTSIGNDTGTVSANTTFTLTGARLAEKVAFSLSAQERKVSFLESRLAYITNTPDTDDKTTFLKKEAVKETTDALSKGKYIENIRTMGDIKKKHGDTRDEAGVETYKADPIYKKALDNNAALSKEAWFLSNGKGEPEKVKAYEIEYRKAFYFNCTEAGVNNQIKLFAGRVENSKDMLDKLKAVPEHEFSIKKMEQRQLPNLNYDEKFLKQLDAALTAKNAPAPAPEQKKRGGRK